MNFIMPSSRLAKYALMALVFVIVTIGFLYFTVGNVYTIRKSPGSARTVDTLGSVMVKVTTDGFSPNSFSVKHGSKVCFTSSDGTAHWPASNLHPSHLLYPEFDPKQGIGPGDNWCFVFDKVGIWKFHDHLFPGNMGTITVN